ncbi:putative alpha-amylase [Helianthus annuus]|nr:putative alpha-amylase [Helianthus annuus]
MIFSDTCAKIIISTTISLSFLEIDIYLLHVSQVLGDVVLNHRCANKQLNWLKNNIGYDGWRLDFVRGFSGEYVKDYIEASNPAFAIGEYWDSLAYEGGDLCYNQDAHRQHVINWINATGGTSSAFDVTTNVIHLEYFILRHNQYWKLIDPNGKPTGVMGWWPSRAVTFVENHDTGSTQGHWPYPYPGDKLMQGYVYILTHPRNGKFPVIFYDHFYDFGLRDVITGLIEARKRARIPPMQLIILSCSITHIISTGRFLVVSNNGVANEIDMTMKGEDCYYPVLWFHGLEGAIYTETLASPNI